MTRADLRSTPRRSVAGLLAAIAIVAMGCGTQTAVEPTSSHRGDAVLSPDAAEVEQLAGETVAQLSGDAEQLEARHYLMFRSMNAAYEACMQSQGVNFVAEFHTLYSGFIPHTTGEWMARLDRRPSVESLANAEAAYDEIRGLTPEEESPEFQSAMQICSKAGNGPSTYDASTPADTTRSAFFRMVDGIEKELGPFSQYGECMSAAGIEFASKAEGEEGWSGLYMFLTAEMPRPPLPREESDESWSEYLELEDRAMAADVECRGAKYEQGLLMLGPQLLEFRARYAAELQESTDWWESFALEAEAAGFTYAG